MAAIEDAKASVSVEVMDQSLLEAPNSDGPIADSSKLQAGILDVEVLIQANFPASRGLDSNFGEVWIPNERS